MIHQGVCRSSTDKEKVKKLFEVVEEFKSPYIDGKVLSFALKMIYWCALKKKEVLKLRIGNIKGLKGRAKNPEIVFEDKNNRSVRIQIPSFVKPVVVKHLKYLRDVYGLASSDDPLVPKTRKLRGKKASSWEYNERKFTRDLEKCTEKIRSELKNTRLIRRAGICNFFETKKGEGLSDVEACIQTARFARIKKKEVELIVTGKIDEESSKRLGRLANKVRREISEKLESRIWSKEDSKGRFWREEQTLNSQIPLSEAIRRFNEENRGK